MFKAAAAEGKPNAIYLHAEIDALVKIKDWDKAYRLVTTRFTIDGRPALAKPCAICQRILKQTGIKFVEYTK